MSVQEFRPDSVVREDIELTEAFRQGDEQAVAALYDRYGSAVFAVAAWITGDREQAADIALQTFSQAWQTVDRFEPGSDFAPWLLAITRRAAIGGQEGSADSEDDPGSAGPVDDAEIERVWTVRRALDTIEAADRDVVRSQHVDGADHDRIAGQLGVSVGTVRARSFRAHRRLARRLAHLRADDAVEPAGATEERR